jgi:hypothetical protein
MRRVITRLLVACCTFALGISLAALRFETRRTASVDSARRPSPRSQTCDPSLSLDVDADTAAAARLPIISYCELAGNPDCYDGKTVRVGARIFWSEPDMFFNDQLCTGYAGEHAAVRLHLPKAEVVYGMRMKTCGAECYKPLDVIVIGRFEKLPAASTGSRASFEIKSFESISRVR